MLVQEVIESKDILYFDEFKELLGIEDIVLAVSPDEESEVWGFYRDKLSEQCCHYGGKAGQCR